MSSNAANKRKRAPNKKAAAKKGRRKEEDVESDLSDSSDNSNLEQQPDEVLIAGHGDVLDEPTRLPEELLKTLVKPAGQLLIFGQVNWDTVGKRDNKGGGKIQPNIYVPHKFTNLKVSACGTYSLV